MRPAFVRRLLQHLVQRAGRRVSGYNCYAAMLLLTGLVEDKLVALLLRVLKEFLEDEAEDEALRNFARACKFTFTPK